MIPNNVFSKNLALLSQAKHVEIAGNKAFSLYQLIQQSVVVPAGFIVFQGLSSKQIKSFIDDQCTSKKLYAVRSSSNIEDSADHSYAGLFKTFLGVSKDDVFKKILLIQNISANKPLKEFLKLTRKKEEDIRVTAIVQEMIDSDVSGVCFTKNPVTDNKNEIIIEAALGLGELIVQSEVRPDYYRVGKKNFIIREKRIFAQHKKLKLSNPPQMKSIFNYKQKLKDKLIYELALQAKKIELFYKRPMDIEWAVKNDNLFILQARPIAKK